MSRDRTLLVVNVAFSILAILWLLVAVLVVAWRLLGWL